MRRVLVDFDLVGELLGLTVDGAACEVERADGTTRTFVPGGEIEALPHRSSPVTGDGAGDQSVRMSLAVGVYNSWALRRTAPFQLATCRIYWWPEGDLLRDEHELFRGCVREPEWELGPDGQGRVTFSLVPSRRIDDVAFPPFLVGDAGRFPDAPDEGKTSAVPVVYGTVYGMPVVAVTDPTVDPVRMVLACHRVGSTTVQLARGGANVGAPLAVGYGIDRLGGTYAYVEVTPATYAAGSDLYAVRLDGWVDGGAVVGRLGDVMEHAFRTYARASWYELDRPRVEAARPVLNRIAVGAYANERGDGTVMQFLQQRLGGQFPVAFSFAGGRFGWDAVLFPRGAEAAFIVGRVTYGQDAAERLGPMETSADDVLTDIELTYGFDGYQAGATKSLRFSPETSLDARRAMSRWGRSPVLTQDAPDVSDSDSAYLLLTDLALKRSRVRHRVEYHGLDERFYFLPLGAVVAVVDADLGWSDEPCILEAVEPRKDGLVDVVLVTLDGQ